MTVSVTFDPVTPFLRTETSNKTRLPFCVSATIYLDEMTYFLDDKALSAEFSSLTEGFESCNTDIEIDSIADAVALPVISKLDPTSLSLTDILTELERRDIQPIGFYSDDAKRVQRCFDQEHEEYVKDKRNEALAAKVYEAKQQAERRKAALLEQEIVDEKKAISNDLQLLSWFNLLSTQSCPRHCRIDINDISSRALAKALWSNSRIQSLDVSNMHLSDLAGAYLSRSLQNNICLVKLELGGNAFGSKTLRSLADSLFVNRTLQFLSLESNPLAKDDTRECISLFSSALESNTRLTSLSLWRCGLGLEAGRMLSNSISKNSSLISVEVGYNTFDSSDINIMTKQLVSALRF